MGCETSIFTQPPTKTVEWTVSSFSDQVNQARAMWLIEISWDAIGQVLTCRYQKCLWRLKNGAHCWHCTDDSATIFHMTHLAYMPHIIPSILDYLIPIIILHFIWGNHHFQVSSLVSEKSTMVRLRVGAPYWGFNARLPLRNYLWGKLSTQIWILYPNKLMFFSNVGLVQT